MEELWPAHTFGRGETFYAGHSRSGSRKDRFFFFFLNPRPRPPPAL